MERGGQLLGSYRSRQRCVILYTTKQNKHAFRVLFRRPFGHVQNDLLLDDSFIVQPYLKTMAVPLWYLLIPSAIFENHVCSFWVFFILSAMFENGAIYVSYEYHPVRLPWLSRNLLHQSTLVFSTHSKS